MLFSPIRTTEAMMHEGIGWRRVWPMLLGVPALLTLAVALSTLQGGPKASILGILLILLAAVCYGAWDGWSYPKLLAAYARLFGLTVTEEHVRFGMAWGTLPALYAAVPFLIAALALSAGPHGAALFLLGAGLTIGLVLMAWSVLTVVGALAGALQTTVLPTLGLILLTNVTFSAFYKLLMMLAGTLLP
ncbi:hypothetical protein Deima_2696 [Deinococcus maricopensis DSM 21211]|uniref:Yip1 domain-containing protein n=2 Tax=Deinococcus TaxID=1298 RepID=E8UB88_DEIML|nr:hypothetical protein Deima_2696 [Deinococcus maricopensis DSM 21211]